MRLVDLVTALSLVADLGMGQPPEEGLRACLLATALGQRMGVGLDDARDIYYTTLLRYIGCTSYAHEEAVMAGGDDIVLRAGGARVDFANPREALSFMFGTVGRHASPLRRVGLIGGVLAAADVYQAMTQERPHRPALPPSTAAQQLAAGSAAGQLDGDAVHAVLAAAGQEQTRTQRAWPARLSEREVEVLRLIAGGCTYHDVARRLTIAPKTAEHHIAHIYTKIDVSTRAAAALFAMEYDLIAH
jgi:DNA-binding CsgD family transcriptional regulator